MEKLQDQLNTYHSIMAKRDQAWEELLGHMEEIEDIAENGVYLSYMHELGDNQIRIIQNMARLFAAEGHLATMRDILRAQGAEI